jgi:methionine--tRNA ligase beta chain
MKKDSITYEEFAKLDFRIGEILSVEPVEKSDKLLALKVNLGEDYGEREILAGVAQFYKPEELIGKKLIFLANLEYRKMMGRESQGMMIAVDENNRPVLIEINPIVENGAYLK